MPWKSWIYHCGHYPSGRAPACRDCSEPGIFDGWSGSVTELMCAYARFYRLAPLGPHRRYADEVFEGTTRPCPRCGGRGYIACGDDSFRACPRCDGCAMIFVVLPEEVETLRRAVLTRFPGAASPRVPSSNGKEVAQ